MKKFAIFKSSTTCTNEKFNSYYFPYNNRHRSMRVGITKKEHTKNWSWRNSGCWCLSLPFSLYNSFLNSRRFISQLTDFFFYPTRDSRPSLRSLYCSLLAHFHLYYCRCSFYIHNTTVFGFLCFTYYPCDVMWYDEFMFSLILPFSRSFLYTQCTNNLRR